MCGINGIFDSKGNLVEKRIVLKMNEAVAHRGPDDEGIYQEKSLTLGHRRLAIIDLKQGHQPIHNEDKTLWIVFNGEIYNFLELKKNLLKSGHRFYTKTDTEVVLHLYEEWGEKCPKKLEGMFAFAVWNKKKKELFLARDPLGEKPLFWTIFENKFIFSSEIKGILACPGFKKKIDEEALAKYFLYGFIPAPQTIFQKIKKVLPGELIVVKQSGVIRKSNYWKLDYGKKLAQVSREEIKREIISLLRSAVEKRLLSDVPLGVLLSGGVDSSLVTALMAQVIEREKVQAFTIGFKESSFDESPFALKVAKHLGIKHHLKIFSEDELFDLLPEVADILDEPMADPSILPTFLVSAFARSKVKVVLSGDGGDESFAGYPKYLAHYFLKKTYLEKLPISLPVGKRLGKVGSFLTYAKSPLYLRNQLWINPFSLEEVEALTGVKVTYEDLEKYYHDFTGKDFLDEAFYLDQKLTLPDLYLVKTDRASMASGLEVRCPFLERTLVEYAAKIPYQLKIRGFQTKSLLKEIAVDFLPKEVIYRPKKGFGIPLKKYLPLLIQKNFSVLEGAMEIFDRNEMRKILKKGTSQQIWTLLVFALWQQKWLKN